MDQNRLYVGNLSYNASREELEDAFGQYGTVTDVHIVMDRETGRSRGFAFIEMGSEQEAQAAIDGLDGEMVDGRALKVNLARPRESRGGQGGGFGGGRGGRGGGRRDSW